MTQTQTLTVVQHLRQKHQALAVHAARTGVIPPQHEDDPAFLELIAREKFRVDALSLDNEQC